MDLFVSFLNFLNYQIYSRTTLLVSLGTLVVIGGVLYFVLGRGAALSGRSGMPGNPFVSCNSSSP